MISVPGRDMVIRPQEDVTLDYKLDYKTTQFLRQAAGALSEELQVIASETHLLLSSTREDDPHRPALLVIDQAINKAIPLARKILGFDDLPL